MTALLRLAGLAPEVMGALIFCETHHPEDSATKFADAATVLCAFIRSPEFAGMVADLAALRAFAQDALENFADGDLDGGTRQDLAVKHGLLRPVEVAQACGEHCVCAEYGDFPMECYRKTPRLTGKEPQP